MNKLVINLINMVAFVFFTTAAMANITDIVHMKNGDRITGEIKAITIEEAIPAYTLGGAHALIKEDRIGSIEAGKYADFIVLNQNLLEIPLDDISDTEVLTTVFGGSVVFEKTE